MGRSTGRNRFERALDALDTGGDFVVVPADGIRQQNDGHEDAAEIIHHRGLQEAHWVFFRDPEVETAFDARGEWLSPVYLNWGGEHDRVLAELRRLPDDEYVVEDHGPDTAFTVAPVDLEELTAIRQAPSPDATRSEIVAHVDWLGRDDGPLSDEDRAWAATVLRSDDAKARAAVLDILHPSTMTDAELDMLMSDWKATYRAYGDSAPVGALLENLREREDPRYAGTLAECEKRVPWSFSWAAATELATQRPEGALGRLRRLALKKGKWSHSAANPRAVEGYIAVLAADEGLDVVTAAEQVLQDDAFDEGAHSEAADTLLAALSERRGPCYRTAGLLAYSEREATSPEMLRRVAVIGADVTDLMHAEGAPDRPRYVRGLLDLHDSGRIELGGYSVSWLREQASQ